MPKLRIQLLGDFRLLYDNMPLTTLDSPRLQMLLAYLVLHRDAPQPRSRIAFLLWPDSTDAQARTNLRNLIFLLRRALPGAEHLIDTTDRTIQWLPGAPCELDLAGFEDAVTRAAEAAKSDDQAARHAALTAAQGFYGGELLPGCYADWVLVERERLQQAFLGVLGQLIQLAQARRDYSLAVQYAQQRLRYDPLDEATYRHLMRLHALGGDRVAALRVYQACAAVLRRELDVEPSAATQRLKEQLLAATRGRGAEAGTPPAPPGPAPFVGREREWAQLQAAWRAAAGRPQLALIWGEAGTGKTRLLEEFRRWADRQAVAVTGTSCHAGEGGLPFAPLIAWLRGQPLPDLPPPWLSEIARLVPDISAGQSLSFPPPAVDGWQRHRLFEALARAVVGSRRPTAVLVDDVQWCDRDTLEWLQFLLRFDPRVPMLVVVAARPEDIVDNVAAQSFLCDLSQAEVVDLRALDKGESARLAAGLAGCPMSPEEEELFYRESEGNPRLLVELSRAGLTGQHPESPLSVPLVEEVFSRRLALLSPRARGLAELAAVAGRSVSYQVLRLSSGLDEQTLVVAVDELCRRHVLRENGSDGYHFSHGKLRAVLLAATSTARRQFYQQRLLEALTRQPIAAAGSALPDLSRVHGTAELCAAFH